MTQKSVCVLLLFFLAAHVQAQIHPADGEYITDWLILGPFSSQDRRPEVLAAVSGQTGVYPQHGDTVALPDTSLRVWQLYHSDNIFVSLLDTLGEQENAVAYAFGLIESESEAVVNLLVGSDDGVAVWVNGLKAHENPTDRPLVLDEDVCTVDLKPGLNPCLVEISQSMGEWSFSVRALPQSDGVLPRRPKTVLMPEAIRQGQGLAGVLWRYHTGDNPKWALPDFDDGGWAMTHPSTLPTDHWKGIGWFRLHFAVDAALWNTPLALNMDYQAGASEIYLDGELLYRFGTVGRDKTSETSYWEREPKAISLSERSDHVLAVRYSNFAAQSLLQSAGHMRIPNGFSLRLARLNPSVENRISEVRGATTFQMVWTALTTFLTLQHLLLFFFFPRSKGHLYFAISTAAIAAFAFIISQFLFITDFTEVIFLTKLLVTVFVVMFLAGMLFLYSLFYPRVPRHFWAFFGVGLLSAACGWADLTERLRIVFLAVIGAFAFLSVLEILRIIVVAIVQKKDGAWIFGGGSIATVILPMVAALLAADSRYEEIVGTPEFAAITVLLGPLITMSVYLARNFARTSRDLEKQLSEVRRLSARTIDQERQAMERENQRKMLEAENRRKSEELEAARELQMSMLPQNHPNLPYLDIAFRMQTATEVGGDYYDYTMGDNGAFTVAIGDVTGHGLNAGIVVSAAKSLFQTSVDIADDVETLRKISHGLKSLTLQRLHMAMTLATVDGTLLRVTAAGMPPALIFRAATGQVEEVFLEGIPLGTSIESHYQRYTTQLEEDDVVLLMSDGLPEMVNPQGELLDPLEIMKLFKSVAHTSPDEIIDALLEFGASWAGGTSLADDATLVVMKVKRKHAPT